MSSASLTSSFGTLALNHDTTNVVTTQTAVEMNNSPIPDLTSATTGPSTVRAFSLGMIEPDPQTPGPGSSPDPVPSPPIISSGTTITPFTRAADPNEIVLTSSDGGSFTTSRLLLIAHSPFFADLFALPIPPTSSPSDPIYLSAATSAGLALILVVLNFVGPTPTSETPSVLPPAAYKYWLGITVEDLPTIAEAAICAQAYDIPTFYTSFIRPILARMTTQPAMGFAIAAISHAEVEISSFARKLSHSDVVPPGIPQTITTVLNRFAPDHLARFLHLSARYLIAKASLKDALVSKQPVLGGDGYLIRCRGGRAGSSPCQAFWYCRKWGPLRAEAAGNVYKELWSEGESMANNEAIQQVVARTVPCRKCANRLAQTFEVSIRFFNRGVERMMVEAH